MSEEVIFSECISCDEKIPGNECPGSDRGCEHHCNHAWTHDKCCNCYREWGEEE